MSTLSNQIVSIWEVIEDTLRCSCLTFSGKRLSPLHFSIVKDAYVLTGLAWHDSLLALGYSPQLDKRWATSLARIDVKEFFLMLKKADSLLLSSCIAGSEDFDQSWDGFKRHLRKEYPFAGDILSPVKQAMVRWFSEKDDQSFAAAHQCFVFPSRLNLPGLRELEDDALVRYLAIEEGLDKMEYTSEESSLITSWYPRDLLPRFYESWEGKHGSGSVADCENSLSAKYKQLGSDVWTDYLDKRLLGKAVTPRERHHRFERQAKLVLVPKSLLVYRSISMEPATLMWYQQGFLKSFVDDLDSRPSHPLRKRFHPSNQERNRDLAWQGSIDGSLSTIDLSNASDSVSWKMVRKWFGNSALYPIMAATRSKTVLLPNGTSVAMKKFAPMGSCLCFPTECIVFAAITECAIREVGGNPRTSKYAVYGDDIVVETKYAQAVIDRLEANGFVVNTTKSFVYDRGNIFRESCGAEFLDGADVAPVRLSRWFAGYSVSRHTPGQILALIDLANDTVVRLPSVRRKILSELFKLPRDLHPLFSSDGSKGIYSPTPTHWRHNAAKYDADYQAFYLTHGGPSVHQDEPEEGDEDIRLFEYLRVTRERTSLLYPEDRCTVSVTPSGRVKWSRKRSPVASVNSPNG